VHRAVDSRATRWIALAIVITIVLGCGWFIASWLQDGIAYLDTSEGRAKKREAAVAFLDALRAIYVTVVFIVLPCAAVILAVAAVRSRGHLRENAIRSWRERTVTARLLLCSVSLEASVLLLEAGAAVWRDWLHRSPQLSTAVPPLNRNHGSERATTDEETPRLPTVFSTQKNRPPASASPLKILVIGESSARGEPYSPWVSVGQIVGWRLERVLPIRQVEVDNWAKGGAILEDMHKRLGGLTYRPDVLVVYVGHNEFQRRFAWMRDVAYYVDDDFLTATAHLPSASWLDRFSPLCRLIDETKEHERIDTIPPRKVTRELVDRPACTAAETAAIVADFRERLAAIVTYCEALGTLPILVIPPGNDAGYDPSRSILAPDTPDSERVRFAHAFARARALEERDPAEAIREFRTLSAQHPEFAETHFRLARLLAQTGAWEEAQSHYVLARECDAMPLRCPESLRQVYRDLAALHPRALLVDGPKVLEKKSRHGIVGDRFFHDAQHPNLAGYAALAEEILKQLRARHAFGYPQSSPVPIIDAESCARNFQIDAPRWAEISRREIWFFHATAYIRYDPKFRIARAGDYERAAALIRSGVDPAQAGMPGWALPPKPGALHRLPPKLPWR
jgi:hypothetical protein